MSQRAAYARFLALAQSGNSHDRRRRRRAFSRGAKTQRNPTLTTTSDPRGSSAELASPEAARRTELIDACVSVLSQYDWNYFITLTFRNSMGPEAIERAIKRFTRFLHENCFGDFPATDVRELYGIRYFPCIERGPRGQHRLHAHLLICGGERVGAAKWSVWREWWNKNYGGCKIEKPAAQNDVAAYCVKYMLKGEDFGFELCSTWADERARRQRAEAPMFQERKIGHDVTVSAEVEKEKYRGERPRGVGPAPIVSGKPCYRCGLVSSCQCSMGTAESGQVYGPELDAGAASEGDGAWGRRSSPSQMLLPTQEQLVLPLHAAANKTVLSFSSRRQKRLERRRRYELARQASNDAACNVPKR